MKRLGLALSTLAACVALSCARPESRGASAGTTLYRHLTGDPPTLDPITTAEELGLRVEDLIFRPLIGLDKTEIVAEARRIETLPGAYASTTSPTPSVAIVSAWT